MRIGKIGHAGLVIATGEVTCYCDPLLSGVFCAGANALWPEVRIDAARAASACDAIVISHSHPDHFSVSSLAALPRAAPVLYPRGDALIESALRRLGFETLRPMTCGERYHLRDLEILPTPSTAPFVENGLCFSSGGATCWNLVDTCVDETTLSLVRHACPGVDVMIAAFQP